MLEVRLGRILSRQWIIGLIALIACTTFTTTCMQEVLLFCCQRRATIRTLSIEGKPRAHHRVDVVGLVAEAMVMLVVTTS